LQKIRKAEDFGDKLEAAQQINSPKRQSKIIANPLEVDTQLYDGFVPEADKPKIAVVRAAKADELAKMDLNFSDERLNLLLPLYKARNYPQSLSTEEEGDWEKFRFQKLLGGDENSQAASYFKCLSEIAVRDNLTGEQNYLLEELKLYAEAILPLD
jgi:exodeoxyribonuclease-1